MKRKLRIASAIVWVLALWTPVRIIISGHEATQQQCIAAMCIGVLGLFLGASADICSEGEK